jgi:hypothetical protein
VRKFVREKLSPAMCCGRKLIRAKDDVLADCVRTGADRVRRFRRPRIGVHAYLAQVMMKPWLHESAGFVIEWLTRRLQDLVDNRRHRRSAS